MESTSEKIPKSSFAEGLDLFEKNAERLFNKAVEAFKRKDFLSAFTLGFTACEQLGSALFILENWDKVSIGKEAWDNFKLHKVKIAHIKARTEIALLQELGVLEEGMQIVADEEYLGKLVSLRTSDSLYVNFDFKNTVWKAPMEFEQNLDGWAVEVLIQAKHSMRDLQIEKKRRGV